MMLFVSLPSACVTVTQRVTAGHTGLRSGHGVGVGRASVG
ncbi:hypothetical protein RVR_10559 [Actinacidiphila reveromycinica]|uniref:Uncharacterized protein n=1 Tax=Actinacidiphila reveromycinica TaxID=659352 RepID=A0A7U3UXK2_9ACTN|nr:hypothetical protein RVR_7686 [Streptomyces sp. SN-593]BBB00613.1 hypothetical protein RVR_10559 [Streptomyces sp. SN-593]